MIAKIVHWEAPTKQQIILGYIRTQSCVQSIILDKTALGGI